MRSAGSAVEAAENVVVIASDATDRNFDSLDFTVFFPQPE